MANKTFIVIGNGFSINIVDILGKNNEIDLRNLFSKGDEVVWPDNNEHGFLSRKYCNSLWTLGARTTMTKEESNKFIGDIITCLNVFNYAALNNQSLTDHGNKDNIYISAHNELSTYFRNLFIYYNLKIHDYDLNKKINDIPLITYIKNEIDNNKEIIIITYNYDIFLERLLRLARIPFYIAGINRKSKSKVEIIKPHGSISFVSKKEPIQGKNFEIKSTFDSVVTSKNELKLDYNVKVDKSLVNAIIPPAGDSNRLNKGWAYDMRKAIKDQITISGEKDNLVIYGLSYDHVDRIELDEIITTINPNVNVRYVNPDPTRTFDIVLGSIFKNYIQIKDAKMLLEV